jgi:hypothetical protein
MPDESCRVLLKDEYLQLHRSIQEFDGRALTIKAWSISFSLVAVVGAFAAHAPAVLLVAAFGSVMFWLIECMWKMFQYAFYERINRIEEFFAGKGPEPDPLQIGRAWYDRWSTLGGKKAVHIFTRPHVALPHAAIAGLALVLFVLREAGAIVI